MRIVYSDDFVLLRSAVGLILWLSVSVVYLTEIFIHFILFFIIKKKKKREKRNESKART